LKNRCERGARRTGARFGADVRSAGIATSPFAASGAFFSRPGFRQIETIAVPHLNHDDVEPMDASLRGSSLLRKSEEWNEP
jgi:hypothetical protein